MERSIVIAVLTCWFFALGMCQTTDQSGAANSSATADRKVEIRLTKSIVVPTQVSGMLLTPHRCDSEGSIYFRAIESEEAWENPVKKVDPQGEVKVTFAPAQASSDFLGADYFVAQDGSVTIAGLRKGQSEVLGTYVATYSKDGTFKSITKLDSPKILPYSIGVFSDGNVLVSGLTLPGKKDVDAEGVAHKHPFTAIFKSDGSLIKELHPDDDARIEDAIDRRDFATVPDATRDAAFVSSRILDGPDGNLYLWRKTSPLTMYVVSPSGEMVRTFQVSPSVPGRMPDAVVAHKGTLGVLFGPGLSKGPSEIVLADQVTGEIRNTFEVEERLGVALACYAPPDFEFLGSEHGKLAIKTASPQ